MPNSVEADRLRNAYMKSSAGKKEPVLVNMSAVTGRDNSMYSRLESNSPSKKVPFSSQFLTSAHLSRKSSKITMFDSARNL